MDSFTQAHISSARARHQLNRPMPLAAFEAAELRRPWRRDRAFLMRLFVLYPTAFALIMAWAVAS